MIYKVSGASFHQDLISALQIGERVHLVPDPENEYDGNAIKVQNEAGELLGWIPSYAHLNEQLKETYSDLEIAKFEAEVTSIIGGGTRNLGLRINVKTD